MKIAHQRMTAEGASPERWILFLHGVLGRRTNWSGFARRIVRARPTWGALLADLRLHGDSDAGTPPHTVLSAAEDLRVLDDAVPGAIRAVLGHSLGGKIALHYANDVHPDLDIVWDVDALPGPTTRDEARASIETVFGALERMPRAYETRDGFLERAAAEGLSAPISAWLAMNLVRDDAGLHFPLDLAAIRALVESHFVDDVWRGVESPRTNALIHLVAGGKSPVFQGEDLGRARRAAERPNIALSVIEDAGHWVHVDAPDALEALVLADIDAVGPHASDQGQPGGSP
ncbi:MAG: alpha/beta hydrolase [Polyangiales bacterium]|nr:alpha/beta hydrolase [Myxococcales bacterium]